MATFVLLHAPWHGAWCWKKVAPLLRAAGHDVYTPTLTGLGERSHLAHPLVGLETHVQDVVNDDSYQDLSEVILLGHSAGGSLILAVAERVPERQAHLITFPRAAWEERVRTEGFGWLVPSLAPVPWDDFVRDVWRVTDEVDRRWMVERFVPTPFKVFTDPVRRQNPAAARLPRAYVRCLQHASPVFDRYAELARQTDGSRLRELDAAHEPLVTAQNELADLLLEIAA